MEGHFTSQLGSQHDRQDRAEQQSLWVPVLSGSSCDVGSMFERGCMSGNDYLE